MPFQNIFQLTLSPIFPLFYSSGRNKKLVLSLWNIFEPIWLQSKTWRLIRMELWWSVYRRTNMAKFLMWSILTWSIFWLLISHQKLQLGFTNLETLYRYSSIDFRTRDYKKIGYNVNLFWPPTKPTCQTWHNWVIGVHGDFFLNKTIYTSFWMHCRL